MQVLYQKELELAHSRAVPIAQLGNALCAVNGVKGAKPDWFNPYGRLLAQQEALQEIDSAAAETFLNLLRENRVPSWVASRVDVEKIQLVGSR